MLGLGGAVVAAFGIAAAAAIVAPVFFALVLTICVHPLRVALERRGVPRGIATGSVITAVTLLLLAFGYAVLVAFGQFAELLPEFADEIGAWAADVAAWFASIGIGADGVSALVADFDPASLVAFAGSLVGGIVG
ncbi:MAG TPA: AI-2E family transporter, partial [Agromyces sp.]|nr:AI-2E family transporter [Agromyces sp.]